MSRGSPPPTLAATPNLERKKAMTIASQAGQALYTGPPFEDARVHDAMRIGTVTCRPETSLHDVARMMLTYQIHAVLVQETQPGSRPLGIVSALDIAAAAGADLEELNAIDVATTDIVEVPSNESLQVAAKLMTEHGISHLVVVEPATDWPCGVLSARDLAAVLTASPASFLKRYGAAAVAQSD
jgi:CBS domain-containing protein